MSTLLSQVSENLSFVLTCLALVVGLALLAKLAEHFLPECRKVTPARRVSIIGICAALAAVLMGGAMEVAQMFTHRGVSFGDLAADAAGAFAVWVPMWLQSLRSQPGIERRRRASDAVKTAA